MENLDIIDIVYMEYLENIGPERHIPPDRNSDIYLMDESKFVPRYRFRKCIVLKILELIDNKLEYPNNRNRPLTPIQQLLLTLRFYATGSFQIVAGDIAGVSKATVSRYVKLVSEAIASLCPNFIKFPGEGERRKIIQHFYRDTGFPGVIGAIDCTHIPILSPGGNISEIFRNRKSYFSLNIQTVCDRDLIIRNVVVRWPGSVHDSYIFDNSELRMKFETNEITDCHLLGDNGYRLSRYLLTPFLNPNNEAQENFNKSHIAARNVVERKYGVWKRRFPCLSLGLRTKLETSMAIIVATAVLHNIGRETQEAEPPNDSTLLEYLQNREVANDGIMYDDVPVAVLDGQVQQGAAAAAYRHAIVENHFTH